MCISVVLLCALCFLRELLASVLPCRVLVEVRVPWCHPLEAINVPVSHSPQKAPCLNDWEPGTVLVSTVKHL